MESFLSDDYNIIPAQDGYEALDIIKKMDHPEKISLIISDQRMPKLTGLQLFEKIKDILPNTLLMILTGYNDEDVIIDAINKVHTYHFILKPFEPNDLKLTVKNSVEAFDRQLEVEAKHHEMEKQYQELKRKNKELRDQLSKSQTTPLPIRESREKAAMKAPGKKENWQEKMKIKPKLLVPPGEAFAPMDDIWEDYI
jgi:response regulator RpfG family c-di-GMP phosphodiesterase